MILIRRLLPVCVLFALVAIHSKAQEPNLKWGKPSTEELNMTSYSLDPEAKAIVLYSDTRVHYEFQLENFKVVKNVRKRIKVLSEEGKRWANGEIVTLNLNDGRKEVITKLNATAYNMVNGKLVKTKMSSDLKEVAKANEQSYLTKFTVPQVTVGTIIEYEYETTSDINSHIDDWVAQDVIPVVYTSFQLVVPEIFIYRLDETGMNAMEHKREYVPLQYKIDRENTLEVQGTIETFIGHDLPALYDYKCLYSIWTYAQRVSVEITAFQPPNSVRQNIAMTWNGVDESLLSNENFGKRLGNNPLANEMRQAGIYDMTDCKQKVDAICQLLQKRVRWNQIHSMWARSPKTVVTQGTGTNGDINMLLINMLRDAGLQAFPLVIVARTHGILTVTRPSIEQFTTVVAAVRHEDRESYDVIDAACRGGYVNVLDKSLLSDRARIISKEQGEKWLDLSKITVDKRIQNIDAKLAGDGTIDAMLHVRMQGGAAMEFRQTMYHVNDSAAFAAEMASNLSCKVTYMQCDGVNDFSPTTSLKMHVERPGKVIYAGRIYMNVMPGSMLPELLFTDERRTLPVELPYPIDYEQISNLWLPNGYDVDELPKPFSMTSEDGSMRFSMVTVINNGVMSTKYKLYIGKTLFMPNEYTILKTFLEEVKTHREAVVLIKRNN